MFFAYVLWNKSEIICSPFSFLHSPTKENLTRVLFILFCGLLRAVQPKGYLLHQFPVHLLPMSLQELQKALLG